MKHLHELVFFSFPSYFLMTASWYDYFFYVVLSEDTMKALDIAGWNGNTPLGLDGLWRYIYGITTFFSCSDIGYTSLLNFLPSSLEFDGDVW